MTIFIKNIREMKRDEHDQHFAIVRSMKGKSDWIKQLDILSPSKELFWDYRALDKAGEWNKDSFQNIYVPRFIKEMKQPNAAATLLKLVELSNSGQNIDLACFCTDESMCHRSIIAGILQALGADVITKDSSDYSHYFKMWYNS